MIELHAHQPHCWCCVHDDSSVKLLQANEAVVVEELLLVEKMVDELEV